MLFDPLRQTHIEKNRSGCGKYERKDTNFFFEDLLPNISVAECIGIQLWLILDDFHVGKEIYFFEGRRNRRTGLMRFFGESRIAQEFGLLFARIIFIWSLMLSSLQRRWELSLIRCCQRVFLCSSSCLGSRRRARVPYTFFWWSMRGKSSCQSIWFIFWPCTFDPPLFFLFIACIII